MKRILAYLSLSVGFVSPTFGQFVGTENFSSALGANWSAASYTDVGGFVSKDLSAGSGLLNWVATTNSASSAANGGLAFLPWAANTGSYSSDWSVSLTVYNNWDKAVTGGQVDIGLQLWNTADSTDYVKVVLKQSTQGPSVNLVHSGLHNDGTLVSPAANSASSSIGTSGIVGISYSSATHVISTFYNFGSGWTLLGNFGIAGGGGSSNATWNMGGSPSFSVGIMADAIINNGALATNNITLNAGTVYADDFALSSTPITAVPEPGTYAAIAGLLSLGFVIYRRRRAA